MILREGSILPESIKHYKMYKMCRTQEQVYRCFITQQNFMTMQQGPIKPLVDALILINLYGFQHVKSREKEDRIGEHNKNNYEALGKQK